LILIFTGKTTGSYLKEGFDIYYKRLEHYIPVNTIVIPESSGKDEVKAMEAEAKIIFSKLLPGDFLIALDEHGREVTSRQLAGQFQKWMVQGIGRVVIVVGGAYGMADKIKERADYTLSLSKLTFTHQMVRLILAEQLYRAMTIIKNEKYHHD
jgi:23S rRNA (pseudouridine1915-N3)-methyltransferase